MTAEKLLTELEECLSFLENQPAIMPDDPPRIFDLGSGLIAHIQKIRVAAMQIAEKKVCAHLS